MTTARPLVVAVVLDQLLARVPGGTGRYTAELTAALVRAAPPGATVTAVASWHPARRWAELAAPLPALPRPRRLAVGRRGLAAAWERGLPPRPRADVVFAPTLLAPRPRAGQGLVVAVHDAVPWTHPQTLTPRGVAFHRRAAAQAARHAHSWVVPSAATAAALRAALPPAGVPLDRLPLHVLPEGLSAAVGTAPPDAAARRAALGLPARYLLTLATLEPRKGLDVALRALTDPGCPPEPLVIAGPPGWGGLDVAAAAGRLGLPPDRVRLLGRLPDADLGAVLAGATAFCAPSREEGFGLPVLEALAHGVPTVVSAAPALVELGGAAVLVTPVGDAAALASALRALCTDDALRARLAAAGPRRAAPFRWEATAAALWPLLAAAVPGRSPG